MGIFDSITDFIENAAGSVFHAITGTPTADEKRQQQQAMQSQLDYYKKQTELSDSTIARARDEQLAQKRRIDEKQIRSLRRNFRPAGLMDSAGADLATKLGD